MFVPTVEKKVWGEVMHIFASDHAAVSLLKVNKGFRCSRHHHSERYNLFAVQEGCICVEMWEVLHEDKQSRIVTPGSTFFVRPFIWHRFNVLSSGRVVEVYWCDENSTVRSDDIVREHDKNGAVIPGGPFDVQKLLNECKQSGVWGP